MPRLNRDQIFIYFNALILFNINILFAEIIVNKKKKNSNFYIIA